MGGEEFIVLLIDTSLESAKLIAEQLRVKIETSNSLAQQVKKKITISLGVTQADDDDDADSLFKRADEALYEAKNTGKNQVIAIEKSSTNS